MERGNIASLFDHSQEAEQARTDAYDGKYDKTNLLKMVGLQKLTYQ